MMKHVVRHIVLVAAAILSLLCGGCAEDVMPSGHTGRGRLVVSVSLAPEAATRSAFDNFDNENDKWGVEGENIETLRIIIVGGDGKVEHNHTVTASNATMLGQYTFEVKNDDTKTIVFVANESSYSVDVEGMEIAGGVRSLSSLLDTGYAQGETADIDALRKLTIALEHNSVANRKMSLDTPLPITAIYTEYIPPYSEEAPEVEKTYHLHRAAVKYSFRIVNESRFDHKLEAVSIDGITDREFLFPAAEYGASGEPVSYSTPSTASAGKYESLLATPLSLPAGMTQAVAAIPSFYVPEGVHTQEMQKVSIALDGAPLAVWKELQWLMPGETDPSPRPMVDLPRNSHVVVNITVRDHDIEMTACLQPYSLVELFPFFGLERDPDGNIIKTHHPDGTYDVIVDGQTIRKDVDGDEVLKDFSDGSLFCKAVVYKDYIHDDTETDYEYPYEKDYSGGNMIVIREKSSGGTYHSSGTGDDEASHDHGYDDRALFVLGKDNEFYRCDWTSTDEKGHPALSREDTDGAVILQCNGYQFRIIGDEDGVTDENIRHMQKYIGTYLVQTKDGEEQLRYYLEDYSSGTGLLLDIELGMADPAFQARYPGVYTVTPDDIPTRSAGNARKLMRMMQRRFFSSHHALFR